MKGLLVCLSLLAAVSHAHAFNWTAYFDIDDINVWLKSLVEEYPSYTEIIQAGESYEGRPILGIKITGNKTDAKRTVMIESGIHAREWIAPATTTYFINQLLTSSNTTISGLKDAVEWHIFPSVNPDGYHYTHTTERLWRKTRSVSVVNSTTTCYGADANRNFDFQWNTASSTSDPCDFLNYAGTKAFSEIESENLSKYIISLGDNLLGYVAFHSDEQCVYVPYSTSTDHVGNYDNMVTVGKKLQAYAGTVNGTEYCGPATAEEISYGASGMSMDWVYQTLGTNFTYIIELRGVNWVFPAEYIYVQGDEVTQMMLGLVDGVTELGYL